MEKIAILIPCYNEEKTIKKVINDFEKELPEAEIYVYNNNSKDKTEEIAKKTKAIVRNEYNQGKGNVVKTMFKEVEADIYVIVDGDDTYPAEKVKELIKPIKEKNADMVIGDRLSNGSYKNQNKRKFHNFGNNIIKKIINKMYKTNLQDILTGYRAMTRNFVKNISITSQEFEVETEITMEALENKYKIIEIPIIYKSRPEGSYSKVSTCKDGMKILKMIINKKKSFNKKEPIKNKKKVNVFSYVKIFFFMISLFLITLLITSLFPSSLLKNNIKESSEILLQEGDRKKQYVITRMQEIELDNYTDALMLNTIYSIYNEEPLVSSLLARKNYLPGITKQVEEDVVTELKSASKYEYLEQLEELKDTVDNNIEESFEYARYWHGYIILLRPLFLIFNITSIRMLFTIIFFVLGIWMLYLISKKVDFLTMIIFALAFVGVDYFYIGQSLQGSFVFFIMTISSIIILLKNGNVKNISKMFFVIGMITNFFDFLTVPIITLGIPMTIYFLLKQKEKDLSAKDSILLFFKMCINWGCGYLLTWITKWLIVDIFLNRNVIRSAIEQAIYRTVGNEDMPVGVTIAKNFVYAKDALFAAVYMKIGYEIIKLITGKNKKIPKIFTTQSIVYIIISIIPIMWYIVLRNHSYRHEFFTYRDLMLSIVCLPISIFKYRKKENISEN